MDIRARVYYEDFFAEKAESPKFYLKFISTKNVIALASIINGKIYNSRSLDKTQYDLIIDLLGYLDKPVRDRLVRNLVSSVTTKEFNYKIEELGFFSRDACIQLVKEALSNPNKVKEKEITDSGNILHFLKALFAVNSELNDESDLVRKSEPASNDFEYCKRLLWPTLLSQFEYMTNTSIKFQLSRGIYFQNFISKSEYKVYLTSFLESKGHKSAISYFLEITNLIIHLTTISSDGKSISSNTRINDPLGLFDQFILEYDMDSSSPKWTTNNLREKPLFRFRDNEFYIIDIGFLVSKLYDGLTFDFYKNSGIEEVLTFAEYRSFIGNFTEKSFFQSLFEKTLSLDFSKSGYEKVNESYLGLPDFWGLNGNDLILFEIKDIIFRDEVMESGDLDRIEEELKKRIANFEKPKQGFGQLLRIIEDLDSGKIELESIPQKSLRRLKIFPILIHSNHFLEMPGVNVLVYNEFMNALDKVSLANIKTKNIQPPAIIHMKYFIEDYPTIRFVKNGRFKNELKTYASKLKRVDQNGFISRRPNKIYTDSYESFCALLGLRGTQSTYSNFVQMFFDRQMFD